VCDSGTALKFLAGLVEFEGELCDGHAQQGAAAALTGQFARDPGQFGFGGGELAGEFLHRDGRRVLGLGPRLEPVDQIVVLVDHVAAQTGLRDQFGRGQLPGLDDGPILVAFDDQRIVGAAGPLSTLAVPPQYYAILPGYRHRGHGRALWRAAMAWGHENGAACKILQAQAQAGSPVEHLYQSEGLTTLGFVCGQDLN
jgi:GNAT superfamily N-acetyltransferase